MTTAVQSEYRNLPLARITESAMNPRRSFDEVALNELADFVSGHKICILFRKPFCCRGRGELHGNRRLPYVIGT